MGNPPEFFGPIPPFNNPTPQPQYFEPSLFFISAITQGLTTVVSTSVDHNYVIGQQVRIKIPEFNKMIQINGQTAFVISIPASNQIEINVDSRSFDPFSTSTNRNQPQIAAIGDINNGIVSSTGRSLPTTTMPGSFQNISPA